MASTGMRRQAPRRSAAVECIAEDVPCETLDDAAEIADILGTLASSGEAITVYPPGQDFAMARVSHVDAANRIFTIAPPLAHAHGSTRFVASLGGAAKIQFELDCDRGTAAVGPAAMQLPLPRTCKLLNRRAAARLETPLGGNYGARLSCLGKVVELPLHDFSLDGVALRATPELIDAFYVGKELHGVELSLGPASPIRVDLEVRLVRPFQSFLLGQPVQVGCRISSIDTKTARSLERAVGKAEAKRWFQTPVKW